MTTGGSFDAPIEIFSGLVTDMVPADFLHGVSPDCLDSNGNLYKETMPGTLSTVASGLIAASRMTAGLSRSRYIKPWLYAPNEWSCSTHLLPDTFIHS